MVCLSDVLGLVDIAHTYTTVSSLALLLVLTPPTLIPYFDRIHSTMLFWLRREYSYWVSYRSLC